MPTPRRYPHRRWRKDARKPSRCNLSFARRTDWRAGRAASSSAEDRWFDDSWLWRRAVTGIHGDPRSTGPGQSRKGPATGIQHIMQTDRRNHRRQVTRLQLHARTCAPSAETSRMIRIREIDHPCAARPRPRANAAVLLCGARLQIERRRDDIGLVQLRAGRSIIDLVPVDGELNAGGARRAYRDATSTTSACGSIPSTSPRFDTNSKHGHRGRPAVCQVWCRGDGPSLYVTDPEETPSNSRDRQPTDAISRSPGIPRLESNMTASNAKGRCPCGAVRIEVAHAATSVGACHCNICRKWGGGPRWRSNAALRWN